MICSPHISRRGRHFTDCCIGRSAPAVNQKSAESQNWSPLSVRDSRRKSASGSVYSMFRVERSAASLLIRSPENIFYQRQKHDRSENFSIILCWDMSGEEDKISARFDPYTAHYSSYYPLRRQFLPSHRIIYGKQLGSLFLSPLSTLSTQWVLRHRILDCMFEFKSRVL